MSETTGNVAAPESVEALKSNEAPESVEAPKSDESPESVEALKSDDAPESIETPESVESQQEKKTDDSFSKKFSALSRKERQLKAQEKAVQAKLKEIEERESKSKEAPVDIISRLKKEPLKVLEESGLSLQQLAEMALNEGKPTAEMLISEKEKAIQARIDALESKLQQKEKDAEEQRLQAAIDGFKNQIQDVVSKNENYELIRAQDASDLVYDVISAHHEETGEILDINKAAELVESHLLEEAKKHLNLSKIKTLLQSTQPVQQKPATSSKPVSKTLTNTSAATATTVVSRPLSNEESIANAAKLIKWID